MRARDGAGNETFASNVNFTVTIDTVAPGAPTLLLPSNGSLGNDNTPTYDWTDVVDPSGVTYQIQSDNSGAGFPSPEINSSGIGPSTFTPVVSLADGVYTWRVRATDGAGNVGAWSAPVFTHTVDTIAPPAPILISPPDGGIAGASAFLDWADSVDLNGVTYTVQVATSPTFVTVVYTSSPAVSNATTTPLAQAPYWWRVRAQDGAGNQSAWSTVWTYTVDTTAPGVPVLVSPPDGGLTSNAPTLDWDPVPGEVGEFYEVWVDTDGAFAFPRTQESTISADSLVIDPVADGTYFWRVRCIDAAGNVGAWTAFWTFVADGTPPTTPTLLLPANGATVFTSTVSFDWTDATDANGINHYEMEIYDAGPSLIYSSNTTTSNNAVTGLPDGTFTWRVRAADNNGNAGAFTATFTFTKSTGAETVPPSVPVLVSPSDLAVIGTTTTTLTWNPSTDNVAVDHYVVELDDSPGFEAPFTMQATTAATSIGTPTLAAGTYVWHVLAVDVNGNQSGWSVTWSFTVTQPDTTPPSTPTKLSPIAGALMPPGAIPFDWTDSTDDVGIANYQIEIYQQDSFGGSTLVFSASPVPSTVVGPALGQGLYIWRVRALDTSGNASAWSGIWPFTLATGVPADAAAPLPPTAIAPISPPSIADPFPTYTWTAAADPSGIASYHIEVFAPGPVLFWSGDSTTTSITGTVALPANTYTWHVRAVDGVGNVGAYSPTVSFTVDFTLDTTPPSVPVKISPLDGTSVPVGSVTLLWLPSSDDEAVSFYEYQLDDTATFTSPVTQQGGTTATTVSFPLPVGTFFWRVRAVDFAGNKSAWTGPWIFNVVTAAPPPPPPPPVPVPAPAPVGGAPREISGDGSARPSGSGCSVMGSGLAGGPDLPAALALAAAFALYFGRRKRACGTR